MLEKIKPYILPITCIILIAAVIFFVVRDIFRESLVDVSTISMKQLPHGIIRAESKYVTRDQLEKDIKARGLDLSVIQKDLDELHARLVGLSYIEIVTPGYHGTQLSSSSTSPNPNPLPIPTDGSCPNLDPYHYSESAQTLTLNEPMGNQQVPWGSTTFRSWEKEPWEEEVYPRKYSVDTTLSETDSGEHVVHNQFTVSVNGKDYKVPIDQAHFEEVPPESHWMFNPHLFLGVNLGATVVNVDGSSSPAFEFSPGLDLSLLSYGKTKALPDFAFLGVGVNYDTQAKAPSFSIAPVYYNVGQHLPLMHNLYVGPEATINTHGDIGVMGTVKVGL